MEKQEEQRIKEKVKFFYDEKCKVHVSRFDKTFWRGLITNIKSDGVFEFYDDKLGQVLLFIADIYDINLFKERE